MFCPKQNYVLVCASTGRKWNTRTAENIDTGKLGKSRVVFNSFVWEMI